MVKFDLELGTVIDIFYNSSQQNETKNRANTIS